MATKLNKVFLNPTAEQIAEYDLVEGVSWFTDMDAIAAALEADKEKKAPERIYTLKNFQIVDGARQITANLSKIAKEAGFTLSNDLTKVIDRAQTVIDYDVDHVTDHRIASAAADGSADLSDFARENATTEIYRDNYTPTADGQEYYEDVIENQKEVYDNAVAPVDTKIIGYKDLKLTNVGSKATAVEEGETFDEKTTTVTQYKSIDVKAGDFSFNYQKDSTKSVDKKDIFLVTESGTEKASVSATASGTLSIKDSVINNITGSFSESQAEIHNLHRNNEVDYLIDTLYNAGAYETVTVDNSTVTGNIKGGKISVETNGTFTREYFLDKESESGSYYNIVSGETWLGAASNNSKLYVHVANTSALTEAGVQELEGKGYSVVKDSDVDNIQVNKYEIVTYDIDGNTLRSGNFVYLTNQEFFNLSDSSQKALDWGWVENNVGYVDYSADRVVTDANYVTFSTAPTGAAASKNAVNKYVYKKSADETAKVTYYLTAAELADGIEAAMAAEGYDTQVPEECVTDYSFRRVAEAVTAETYKTEASDAYNTVSTAYQNYTVSASMSEEAAMELNKAEMANGFVWIDSAAPTEEKALFRMSQFTKSGDNSVETKYYLSASEMSAMGFFGDGVTKTFDEVKAMAYTDLKLDGWAFTDNAAAGTARVYTNADGDDMYRNGPAATMATIANYTADKTDVVTDTVPYAFYRFEISHTTASAGADLLKNVAGAAQFDALVAADLVGANSQFVTVIDGQAVDMYQIYGYGATVTDAATVTTEKFTSNASEIEYDGDIQAALWEGDFLVTSGQATLVDGIKTQNNNKFFDQYASLNGEYVDATEAEKASGVKVHDFITVAEARVRSTTANLIYIGYAITDVQAKVDDGTGKFVAAYIDSNTGDLTKEEKDATANVAVNYYKKGTVIYALTDDEATAAAGASLIDDTTKVYYYTTANMNGWFADDATAKAAIGDDAKKAGQPAYRDYKVTIADPATDISAGAFTTLKQAAQLTNEANWLFEKAYVTEKYNNYNLDPDATHNYDRAQVDGKDAYWQWGSKTLVAEETVTFDAVYDWELRNDKGGTSVDGLTYYMTEKEMAQVAANLGDGYPATSVFEKTSDSPHKLYGEYWYRLSQSEQSKDSYLTFDDGKDAISRTTDEGPTLMQWNPPAYNNITYVVGEQVYQYTLEGDNAIYYLTEDEAMTATIAGWGVLTQGDKVEGAVHYGTAASYDPADKANFTKDGTVYYFTDSYTGKCISQDSEGAAVQAFNADGVIWSNIDGTPWTVDEEATKYSNYASELCDNTYNYNYNGYKAWTAEQILQISAAEEAAGIATWKMSEVDGQIVWTRTSAIGEVSTYAMEHENVKTAYNGKENYSSEATGSILVSNGSEVRGQIRGYLNAVVTDSQVDDVIGGNFTSVSNDVWTTSKGSVAKDGTRTITVKKTWKDETKDTAAGTFAISRTESDKVYDGAEDIRGYETVSISGVDTDDVTASSNGSNHQWTSNASRQITFTGDPDALRSDYINDWSDLAFTKGIVSKVTAETTTDKDVYTTVGSATITGRDYKFVPGETKPNTEANWVDDIHGFRTVTLTNANADDISAEDATIDTQSTYKVSTKNNVDTATETVKLKDETKALATLTATNTVTNPDYEADLVIGDIDGFKTVTAVNYSFADANALGEVTISRSTSSSREAVASDMRLVNAGVDPDYGYGWAYSSQKYTYGGTTAAAAGVTYANDDMSYSGDTTTKRTAVGTLSATGRAYTVVNANYTDEIPAKGATDLDPVYAYKQTASGRTYYLTENQFDNIVSGSAADKAQWTKGTEVVYYRNSNDAVYYFGTVSAAQLVYEYKNAGETVDLFLTEGEAADYNLTKADEADKLTKVAATAASLRMDNTDRVYFNTNIMAVYSGSGNVGTVDGVWHYKKDGEEDQYLTDAEAAELGGWTKDTVDTAEYVRKANAADNRSVSSVIAKDDMTGDLKVYQNKFDSSIFIVINANEEAFIKDTFDPDQMADYVLVDTKGYRRTTVDAGISANTYWVSGAAGFATAVSEAHSYVTLNKYGEITAQAYVTDAEYALLHADGKAMADYVKDDESYDHAGWNKAQTQYQLRVSGFEVTADTTLGEITANSQAIAKAELYGLQLTDEQAAAADVYADDQKSEFVLSALTEDPIEGNTSFGNIYGYKEVTLSDMVGGNIFRVADSGAIAADNETNKATYKKTISKGKGKNAGKTTYTENDSSKSTRTWSADGSVTLIDTKAGDIAGYKTVSVMTADGTVEVGQISRTTQYQSIDKRTNDVTTKIVTEDATDTFKVTATRQVKTTLNGTAAGSVSLIGQRAGQDLKLDDSVVYKTAADAVEAAQDAIDAFDDKQFADVIITGGVVGYQDVTVTNATVTAGGVVFDGGKFTRNTTTNQTTVAITDNNSETVTVMNKINDSSNITDNATGSLTLTNVNYADPNGYVAGSTPVATDDYTAVNEYVFNGVTYALTTQEQVALLKYGDFKQKNSTEYYFDVLRPNDSITVPAVELTGTLQDVVKAKGVNGDIYTQNLVYFAAKAKDGTGTMVDLYISADKANELLDGDIADIDDPGKKYTEATVDTSKKFYGNGAGIVNKKADFEENYNLAADVKKYVVTADEKATTYYLTDAEANVMKNIEGMDVAAGSDTAVYTRMTTSGEAVWVSAASIAAADAAADEVYEFRGVEKDTGVSASYYLTDTEAAACLTGEAFENFGKVAGTAKIYRYTPTAVTADNFKTQATEDFLRTEVVKYSKDANPDIYLTEAEFGQIAAIDKSYEGYAKAGDTKYYRVAASAYGIADSDDLNDKFTSVNESAEVFEVTNNLNAETLGYLTRAEILALKETDFDDNYTVNYGTTYLRAADDTTKIIKVNPFEGGYVVAPGADLSDALFNASATQTIPAPKASADGFQTVTLTNADMADIDGGNHTSKTTQKLSAKKNSTIATYTVNDNTTDTATGSLTASDSMIGDASWYDTVTLTAAEMDKDDNKAGDIRGGKVTHTGKTVYTSQLQANKWDYSTVAKVIEYTETTKDNETASGSATLSNVVAGSIRGYKDVTVTFASPIETGNNADPTKNQVGSITGGNSVRNETTQFANTNGNTESYSESTIKETLTAVGTVTLNNVFAAGNVSNFQTANVYDSEIAGDLTGGNWTLNTKVVDVNGAPGSTASDITLTAVGTATVAASKVGGDIAQFKDVVLTGGVEVGGDIVVGDNDDDAVTRGATENTACYAVFYTDGYGTRNVVYLTADEYKVFATEEASAMIDTTVAVYRAQDALTDAQLKNAEAAVNMMKGFTAYTDDPITDGGFGQEGKNTENWTVKTPGNSLVIDGSAKIGGKVQGYMTVAVSGAASFEEGFFGTAKNDTLVVDGTLATFTTVQPGKNPVGFDFCEGKDTLVLNGTIGIQAAFKYDAAEGTNAWNLEAVSGAGTIVCRTEDVDDVKAVFAGVNVVGSDNYDAVNALDHQEYDDAWNVADTDPIADWLGFCNKSDYFENNLGADAILSFSGDSVTSGDIVAQMTVDGGATYTTLKSGDTVTAGAVVRISQLSSSSKASNDYVIAFK